MQYRAHVRTALSALTLILVTFTSSTNARAIIGMPGQPSSASFQEPQQPDTKQPDQSTSKSAVFTGTIVKSGSTFLLKDAAGKVYMLDAPDKAEPFEGKNVKITGRLEPNATLLHVDAIEELTA